MPARKRILLLNKTGLALLIFNVFIFSSITIFLATWLRAEIVKEQRVHFTQETNDITAAITSQMRVYQTLLYSGRGLFASNSHVTQQEWNSYTTQLNLPENYPGIDTLAYNTQLIDSDKAAFLAQMRLSDPHFAITPAGTRPTYAVVTYFAPPTSPTKSALGVDILTDPTKKFALIAAIDSGQTVLSQKVTLIGEGNTPAFLLRLAIYKNGMGTATEAERKKAIQGYISAALTMNKFISTVLKQNFQGVRFAIYDGDSKELTKTNMFYNNLPISLSAAGRLSRHIVVPIFSRQWTIIFTDTSALSLRDKFAPTIILWTGFLFMVFSTVLLYVLLTRKRIAEKIAEHMTEALRQSEQKYRTIFETLQDVYYETDTQGNITTISPSIEAYTGIHHQEIVGKKAADFYINPKERQYLLETLQKQGYILDYEVTLRGKEGKPLAVSVTSKVLHDAAGNVIGVAGMLRDITRRKLAEGVVKKKNHELEAAHTELEKLVAKLKADKKKLEEAMTKDEFLSMAAHELRTPLGTMRWRIEDMLGGKRKFTRDTKEDLGKIYNNILRLIHIVNNLLDVSRINQEKIKDNPDMVDVVTLATSVIDTLDERIQEKAIQFIFDKPKAAIPMVIDQNMLEEIFVNLLTNAIKYNKQHGKVTLGLTATKNYLMITVEDTGIGIPKNDQKTIFDKFKRGSNVDPITYEGTGLGLFIVKNYIAHWKGKISLKSAVNKGTKITIAIPLQRP